MSKVGEEPKPFAPGELDLALVQLANSGPNSIGFIAKELVKIAITQNGKFDVTNPAFAECIAKLATNPEPGPYSLKETEDNLDKNIAKLKARGADLTPFNQIKAEFASSKADLLSTLQTNEGLSQIIAKTVTDQIILNKADFYLLDDKKKPRPMTPAEKMNYVHAIQRIAEPLPPEALAIMLDPKKLKEQELIKSLIYQAAVESFTPDKNKKIKDGWAQLDSAKFKDPANQKKFNDLVKSNLTNISARYEANVLVNDAIEQIKKQHGVDLTPQKVEKLIKTLVPTLTKLGPEYLGANKAALTKELSDSLRARQTATSKLGSNYTITTKNLKKIASKIDKTHQPKAAALIKAAKVATPEALAEPKPKKLPPPRPPKLPPPRPPKGPVPPPIPKTVTVVAPPEALVAKPTSLKPPPPLPRTVVTVAAPDHAKAIINDSIKQLQMEHKVKFTPEKIATLTKALAPALAKFGPEYMQTHKATLTRELSSSLRSGQGFISQATGTYSISNSELEKITNKMNKVSLEVSNTTVKTAIGRMSESEITGKLNAFAKEAGGKTFDKAPTVEDIAKIRLSNPKKFDQIFNAPKPLSPDLQEKAHNAPTKSTSPRPPAYPPPKPPATKGQGGGHVM